MSTDTSTDVKKVEKQKADKNGAAKTKAASDSYVLPVVGTHVPSTFVNVGFWSGLAGAAALGIVDPPLALFVGAGVVIARHRAQK